ncbi:hypothetical protein [uncultured Dialister sp.]|uniref:hypothetical protein n=1 Tax=uncultured Dialister sp. TaxID=278064 RepID=UPI0026154A0B|nr:hypothetical protein [uncultured Dialister sp.]
MRKIQKPEYKRKHPYVPRRSAWNLDDFFSPIFCAGLRRFLTLELDPIPADFKTEKEWKDAIRRMLWAFEQHYLDFPDDPWSIWYDREERKLKEAGIATYIFDEDPIHPGMIRQLDNLPEMPPKIENAMVKYNIKVQKGIRLFAKYYRDLYTVITPRPAVRRKRGEKPPRKRQLAKIRKEPLISEKEAANLVTLFTPLICAGLNRFLSLDLTGCIDVIEGVEGWKRTVNAMVWSFEQIRQDYRDNPLENWLDYECRKREEEGLPVTTAKEDPDFEGWSVIRFNVPEVPIEVRIAQKAYEEELQEGLDLFGKYFKDIWD